MSASVLELHDVTSGYDNAAVLNGVSLAVSAGEAVAVLGANGAGKSTLLRTVSGIVPTWAGSIRFLGEELSSRPAHDVARLGIAHVPEGRAIFPGLTLRENLTLGTYSMTGRQRAGAGEAFERVMTLFPWMRDRLTQLGGTLSGGQQQMLAIGRGLMGLPRLLMLDEPSLGLSPLAATEVFDAIGQIHATGVAILLVEQNSRKALALATHGYVLNKGRVAVGGPSAQLAHDARIEQAYFL